MFDISDTQKKVLSIWAIAAVIIFLVVILIAVITNRNTNEVKETITNGETNTVIDRNRYYTVKNAITKYYSYVNMGDYASVIKILNSEYVKKNNIDINNVGYYLTDTDINLAYQSKVMCLKSINSSIYSFVVEGDEISANTGKVIGNKYYEITMDGTTLTFDLMPIDESTYKEVCNG